MNRIRVLSLGFVIAACALAQTFHPDVPRTWDDREVEGFELPLAQPDRSPRYLSAGRILRTGSHAHLPLLSSLFARRRACWLG